MNNTVLAKSTRHHELNTKRQVSRTPSARDETSILVAAIRSRHRWTKALVTYSLGRVFRTNYKLDKHFKCKY